MSLIFNLLKTIKYNNLLNLCPRVQQIMINLFKYSEIEAACALGMPINPYTRELDLPTQLSFLNSSVLYLQLQDSSEGLKVRAIENPCIYSLKSIESEKELQADNFDYFNKRQILSNVCSDSPKSKNMKIEENLLNENTEKSTEFKISLPSISNENITVKDSDHSESSEFYEIADEKYSKDYPIDSYPHEVVLKKNIELDRMQKYYVCRHAGCCKEFTKSWNLIYHARIHTNEKPFKCTYCIQCFAQKGNLKRHLKTHSETALCKRKKFQCTHCLKKYTTKFNLKVHCQTKHKVFNDDF